MNILITGVTGFVGRHLVHKLRKEGHYIVGTNRNTFEHVIINTKDIKFDYIIHLAVKTAAGGYCQTHPGEQFLENQKINTEILKYWKEVQPQAKFITFGSSCGYDKDVIKSEENYLKGEPEPGYEVYGNVKRNLLVGLKALNQEYGMQYSYLIPSVFYGPQYELEDKHFIFDLIRKISNAKYRGEKVILWGTGEQTRELIYIDDAVNIINDSLTWDKQIVNLSSGKEHSLKNYAQTICNILDYNYDLIEWDTNAFVGSPNKKLINTHLQGYEFTPLEIGLKHTIDYYLSSETYHNYMALQ